MGRRLLVAAAVVLLFVGAGAGIALLTSDDSSDTSTAGSTSTSAPASSSAPSSTTPATTAAPATTTPTVAPADAALPDPCGAEGATIKAAIDNGVDGAAANAQVDECRLAAVDPSWAAVRLVAKPGGSFDTITVLVHGGGGSWEIVGSGAANVGCGAAPQQVLVDLGIVCSSSGGGGL
ncbi:MAG TPA: hypothetical protein VFZ17_05400 [Acidimicrobiia bacterium]|nr:hypothetical protein [Acidimicrobiia bacterium]